MVLNRYAKTVKGVQVGRGVYKLGKLMGVSIERNGMVDLYTIRRDLYMGWLYLLLLVLDILVIVGSTSSPPYFGIISLLFL